MRYILAGLRNKIQAACLPRKKFTCEHVVFLLHDRQKMNPFCFWPNLQCDWSSGIWFEWLITNVFIDLYSPAVNVLVKLAPQYSGHMYNLVPSTDNKTLMQNKNIKTSVFKYKSRPAVWPVSLLVTSSYPRQVWGLFSLHFFFELI